MNRGKKKARVIQNFLGDYCSDNSQTRRKEYFDKRNRLKRGKDSSIFLDKNNSLEPVVVKRWPGP